VLKKENPRWDDQRLFDTAWLINSALMAKIHTVEWTPGIVNTPALWFAMNVNWSGGHLRPAHQGPLRPARRLRDLQRDHGLAAGAPRRALPADRGVRLRLPDAPADPRRLDFEALTDDSALASTLQEIYGGNIERVDLIVGLFAEKRPQGFAFSDTTFRIFLAATSRRLNSDRFFTHDYTPEIYTQTGLNWIENNTMSSVLLRHYPQLRSALRDVDNAFKPWRTTST
jgi:hypothetical protein